MPGADEKQFRAMYERHSGALLRFLFRFTADQARAEELLHDVFLEFLNSKSEIAPGALQGWLFTVAKNKALNHQRHRSFEESVEDFSETAAPTDDSTEQALAKLAASEARLPADLRETWGLRRQGLGYEEIAARLAIPLGTVKSRFHRLVLVLREEWEK